MVDKLDGMIYTVAKVLCVEAHDRTLFESKSYRDKTKYRQAWDNGIRVHRHESDEAMLFKIINGSQIQ